MIRQLVDMASAKQPGRSRTRNMPRSTLVTGVDKNGLEHVATQTISAIDASYDTRMRFCLRSAARNAGRSPKRHRQSNDCIGNRSPTTRGASGPGEIEPPQGGIDAGRNKSGQAWDGGTAA
jgi:hypothetical protein